MRHRLTSRLLLALSASALALAGCDDQRKPEAERTGPSVQAPSPEDEPGQGEHTPVPGHDGRAELDHRGTWDDNPTGGDTPPRDETRPPGPDADAGRVAVVNGRARLPFPEAGETLRTPIAFPRLSDDHPFQNIIDPEDIPDIVPWEEAGEYVGYEITVEGRIVSLGQSRDGKVNFLNFHRDWRGKFYMVLFDDLASTLDQTLEELFLNKLVRVRGLVEDHRGRPQIKIESMDQVEFVDEGGGDGE